MCGEKGLREFDAGSDVMHVSTARCTLAAVLCLHMWVAAAAANDAVRILVLKEHGVGSPTLAQPYLDRFVARAAKANDWDGAKGQYFTQRAPAEEFIAAEKPRYGILSLAAFLALRQKYQLSVLGRVSVKLVGGRRYDIISKSATDLKGCLGKTLATDHADDPRFIDRVVARGAFTLSDFTLIHTQRPLQTIKKVLNDEAACALVDDAQVADISHLPEGAALHSVWHSAELPPMVVVAFPGAPADDRERFQKNLRDVCTDGEESACVEVGIVVLEPAGPQDYADVLAAYGK